MKKGSILVVDDEPIARENLEYVLKKEGYDVVSVGSGVAALERLSTMEFDLVLTDLKMKIVDGMEVLARAKELYPDTEVIMITAFATVDTAIEAMQKGAYHYISKPYKANEARIIIQKALEKQRLKRRAQQLQEEMARNLYDLAAEQSRIRTVLTSMVDGVLVTNRDLEVVLHNPSCMKLLGFSPSAAPAGTLFDYIEDDTLCEALKNLLMNAEKGVEPVAQELFRKGNHLRVLSAPVFGPEREVLGTVTVFRDVTASKKAEEALLESEERYRTVLEASPDPIVVYDMEGKVMYINPAFAKVFGWEIKDLWGRKTDFVPEENRPETQKMIDMVTAGESFSGVETRRYNKGKDIIDVSISAAVYRDRNGVPQGSVVNLRDITEQKKLEAHIRQTQKLLAVGRLAAGVAHEINNPLTSILTTSMLLQEEMDPQHSYFSELQTITEESLRCSRIVSSLLDFARQARPMKKSVNVVDIIRNNILLKKQVEFKGVAVEYRYADDIPPLHVDKSQVEQAIINLTLNAIEATEPGGKITFEVRLSPRGNRVEILISDTGAGIPEDDIDHIFDPFFTTREDGTGLGLPIAHGIIERHGGNITVKSKVGEGTCFTISLPLKSETLPHEGGV